MRNFETKQQEENVMIKVVCNCCGKEIPSIGKGVWEEHFHAEKTWGYSSAKDGQTDSFDLCQDCYENWISSFQVPLTTKGE